jgi:hypothetical protein
MWRYWSTVLLWTSPVLVDKGGLLVKKVVGPRDWSHPQVMAMFERLLAAPDAGS